MISIRLTDRHKSDVAANRARTRQELSSGKITVRWLKFTALHHIFVGSKRPMGIGGFESEADAWAWLKEEYNIERNS